MDRSAAYAGRYIAKNLVAAGVCDECQIQISYAIGVARPLSIFINTFGTTKVRRNGKVLTNGQIAEAVGKIFDLRPAKIIDKFGLKNPIYEPTASYGHFGREPYTRKVTLIREGRETEQEVQFFGWEKLDSVERIRKAFEACL